MRRLDPFDRRAMVLSVGLHLVLFALGWLSRFHRAPELEFVAYEIDLVSPPPAVQAEEPEAAREEFVVETPQSEPEPAPPEPEEVEVAIDEPEPPPEPEPEPEAPPPPEPEEQPTPAMTPEPTEPEPEVSGEGINVRMEGLRRDYPEYYNNIIRQIQRCFRWSGGGSWETKVSFVIHQDGSVSDLEFVARSGNTSFDFEAMGAVDCAGQGRFGPLPEDLPYESLPILFDFRPIGGVGLLPGAGRTGFVVATWA